DREFVIAHGLTGESEHDAVVDEVCLMFPAVTHPLDRGDGEVRELLAYEVARRLGRQLPIGGRWFVEADGRRHWRATSPVAAIGTYSAFQQLDDLSPDNS